MFSRIKYKLFMAILLANALLLIVVVVAANWIFSTSFSDYLNRSQAERLQPLVQALAMIYEERRSWKWVRSPQDPSWRRLMRGQFGQRPRSGFNQRGIEPPPGAGLSPARPPPGAPAIRPGILLRDAERRLLIGPRQRQADAHWIPILVAGDVVGYLGFVRRLNVGSDLDRLFTDRMQQHLAWLLLGVFVISVLVTIPLAARFVGPIEKLRSALRELASGNFQVKLERYGRDEFAQLQVDCNRLAETMARNLAARQRWIADISHELRTPVAVLRGEIEAILDGVRKPEQVHIKSLHQEIMRLSHLIDDLYQLSLSDQGAMSYKNERLDLRDLLATLVEQQNAQAACAGLEFKLDTKDRQYPVFGDPRRLAQLFSNLANNSRFYTEKPGKVEIVLDSREDFLEMVWSDSAPGVGDTELRQLFDRLYRVEESRNRNAGGSGLGLAICRNIVEAMQGSIVAEHASLGGVAVKITLPLVSTR